MPDAVIQHEALVRRLVTVPKGLIGLPHLTAFALIEHDSSTPVRLLQSLSVPDFVFVLIDPLTICPAYELELSDDVAAALHAQQRDDLLVLNKTS